MAGNRGVPHRIAAFLVGHPFLALFMGFVVFAVCLPGGQWITPNFSHSGFFYPDDPKMQALHAFEKRFGNDETVSIAVHSPSGVFDRETAEVMLKLTDELWQLQDVIRVDTLANHPWVHAEGDEILVEDLIPDDEPLTAELLERRREVALSDEIVKNYLVNDDGTVAMAFARLRPELSGDLDLAAIHHQAEAMVASLEGGDHVFYLAGAPSVNTGLGDIASNDMAKLVPVVFLVSAVFLAIAFRTVGGVVFPAVVQIMAIMAAMTLSGWLGIEINSINAALPQILIALGVANAVHVLTTFYNARRRGLEKRDAAQLALRYNFLPTILTSVTTTVGFFSFATTPMRPVVGLGVLAGFGTVLVWFFTYTVMAGLMVLFPSRLKSSGTVEKVAVAEAAPWATRYAAWLGRYRFAVIGVGALLGVVGAVAASQVQVNAEVMKWFRPDHPVRVAHEFMLEHGNGYIGWEWVLDSGEDDGIKSPEFLAKVEEFERRVRSEIPQITKTISLVDIIKQTNRALKGGEASAYQIPDKQATIEQELFFYTLGLPQGMNINDRMSLNGDALRVSVLTTIEDTDAFVAAGDAMRRIAKEVGLDGYHTGKFYLYYSMNEDVVVSILQSVVLTGMLISLLLGLYFRSPKVALIAIFPNLVPLLVGLVVMVAIIQRPLDMATAIVFAVGLGIAVDDTIHVITHYLEHLREGRSANDAVAMVVTHSGPALTLTTVCLVVGFGLFMLGDFEPNRYFGLMTAVILALALVCDLTLLPALLMSAVKGAGSDSQEVVEREAQPEVA